MSVLNTESFTLKYQGISHMLISDCGICTQYNPETYKIQNPEIKKYKGLWDTGATGTVITKKVVEELGLVPTGFINSYHANGSSIVNTYLVNVTLPNGVMIHTVKVTEGILNGFDVLIGMDVITKGDFSITNKDGKTVFSFQIPSTHFTDFVEEHEREIKMKYHTPIVKDNLPGRNEPCHCGSGIKYKNCHGK